MFSGGIVRDQRHGMGWGFTVWIHFNVCLLKYMSNIENDSLNNKNNFKGIIFIATN